MQRQFSAIICDLDGTLLDGNHKLGQFTASVLEKVATLGVDIFIATGRNYPDVEQVFNEMSLRHQAVYQQTHQATHKTGGIQSIKIVSSNGARVSKLSGETLSTDYIDSDIAKQIMTLNQQIKLNDSILINSYQSDDWFISAEFPFLKSLYADFDYDYQVIDFADNHGEQCEKIYFQALENFSQLQSIEAYIAEQYEQQVQITYSAPYCLEIMAKGVNKANALSKLTAMNGYGLMDCLAFGDGLNDVEMLSQAGRGCLMKNADARVLPALRHLPTIELIGHHKDEAVATYLLELFELG